MISNCMEDAASLPFLWESGKLDQLLQVLAPPAPPEVLSAAAEAVSRMARSGEAAACSRWCGCFREGGAIRFINVCGTSVFLCIWGRGLPLNYVGILPAKVGRGERRC